MIQVKVEATVFRGSNSLSRKTSRLALYMYKSNRCKKNKEYVNSIFDT